MSTPRPAKCCDDPLAQHEADVLQTRVSAGVGGAGGSAHRGTGGAELLPRPLGDDDDGVGPLFQTTLEVAEKAALSVELQWTSGMSTKFASGQASAA